MSDFRAIDRETGFLLPPSVDEWLPDKHLGALCRGVIKGLDLSAMVRSYRGSGSASYHPAVLFIVLVYGYATGVFSSRKLECGTLWRRSGDLQRLHPCPPSCFRADGAEDVGGGDAVIMGRSCATSGHASNDKRSADISSLDNLRIKSLRPSIIRWRMNDT
jgi:hypothetical protein